MSHPPLSPPAAISASQPWPGVAVPLDDDGLPPERLDETWLWHEYGSELINVDTAGVYELESVAGSGRPWLYLWAPSGRG
ncbi:hypothetical protein [Plantactinospora sp. CA-290183]|uniref:hypothetical protein n=1 Tax=Plantactinospora sp. CA-290183 TaxID=3240006 RepID=UPI003D94DB28